VNCPRCDQEVTERKVGGSRAGVCPSCRGAWVPFESMEAVLPRLAELAPAGEPSAAAAPAPAAGQKLKCPNCGGDLVTLKDQGAGGAQVHACLVCFGRWVDGSELGRLRGGGLKRLLASFLRMFRSGGHSPTPGAPPGAPPAEESSRTETPGEG